MIDQVQLESVCSVLGDETPGLITMFERTGAEQLLKARAFMVEEDRNSAAECLHSIKGSGSYLGATALSTLCVELMRLLKSDSAEIPGDALENLEVCFRHTTERLHQLVQAKN